MAHISIVTGGCSRSPCFVRLDCDGMVWLGPTQTRAEALETAARLTAGERPVALGGTLQVRACPTQREV